MSYQGKYVTAEQNGEARADQSSIGPSEKWHLIFKGSSKVNLKNSNRQKYLVAETLGQVNADHTTATTLELFGMESLGYSHYAFKSYHGKYLVAESDGALNADSLSVGSQEKFTAISISKYVCVTVTC